jgi:diguanylate cyclase (GGDEF)-like protein
MVRGPRRNRGRQASDLEKCLKISAAKQSRVSQVRQKNISGLDGCLSSALSVAERRFGNVARDVVEISRALKSNALDNDSLRVVGHPAVRSAMRDAILERELRLLALTDDLTSLYNRRGFFAAATQQVKIARRSKQCMLLFFCDVDNLKLINDCHGHQEGDFALIRAAVALQKAFRNSDILARFGGDEFVALAIEAAGQSERIILKRIEDNLKRSNGKDTRCALSLSVGFARFDPRNEVTLAGLLAQADQAMYECKRKRQALLSDHAAALRTRSSKHLQPARVAGISRG